MRWVSDDAHVYLAFGYTVWSTPRHDLMLSQSDEASRFSEEILNRQPLLLNVHPIPHWIGENNLIIFQKAPINAADLIPLRHDAVPVEVNATTQVMIALHLLCLMRWNYIWQPCFPRNGVDCKIHSIILGKEDLAREEPFLEQVAESLIRLRAIMISRKEISFYGKGQGSAWPVGIIDEYPTGIVALNGSLNGEAVIKSSKERPDFLKLAVFQFVEHTHALVDRSHLHPGCLDIR